jgi:hypothetical protein
MMCCVEWVGGLLCFYLSSIHPSIASTIATHHHHHTDSYTTALRYNLQGRLTVPLPGSSSSSRKSQPTLKPAVLSSCMALMVAAFAQHPHVYHVAILEK